MKKNEIVIGGVYTNKKGSVRKVIGMGPEFKSHEFQENEECLQYEILQGKHYPYARGLILLCQISFQRHLRPSVV
jgi:hypothetical protein